MSDDQTTPPPPSASPYQPAPTSPYGTAQPYTGSAPAAYGQVPGQPYYWTTKPPTNAVAIVALVLGLVTGIGGIIAGHIALSQIKRTGEGGRGMALAGLIIGYVFTSFWVLYILFVVIVFAALGTYSNSYY